MMSTNSRIAPLACAMMAALTTGGIVYGFGLYGNNIKQLHHLSQDQINTISAASFCSGLISWVPGMMVDRLGSRFCLLTGGIGCLISMMWFWSEARAPYMNEEGERSTLVVTLSTLGMVSFTSSALIIGSVFKLIVVYSEPHQRGTLVGIAKGYTGLGAGTYTCLFEALRAGHARNGASDLMMSNLGFLPVAAVTTFLVTLPALWLLPKQRNLCDLTGTVSAMHLQILYSGLAMLGVVVIGMSILIISGNATFLYNYGYAVAALIFLVWQLPFYLVWIMSLPASTKADQKIGSNGQHLANNYDTGASLVTTEMSTLLPKEPEDMEVDEYITIDAKVGHDDSDLNLGQALQTVELWLMFYTCCIVVGSGTVMTNNMGEMVVSREFPSSTIPVGMSLFSVAQSASRVATGMLSELVLRQPFDAARWSIDWRARPMLLALASVLAALAHFLLALPGLSPITFLCGVTLSGIAFGMVWPLMVLIVGEVFGKTHLGAIYMWFDGITLALGTLLLSKIIAQAVYERQTCTAEFDPSVACESLICKGVGCFQWTHLIIAGLSLSAVFTSVTLARRTTDNRY